MMILVFQSVACNLAKFFIAYFPVYDDKDDDDDTTMNENVQ